MARKVTWTKTQNKKLQRAVKRWNDKIKREVKKNNKLLDVPSIKKLTVKDVKKDMTTINDLNRFLRQVDRAFRPGTFETITNDQGAVTTKWELNEIKLGLRRINKVREQMRSDLPDKPEYYGTQTAVKKQIMPNRKVDFKKQSRRSWALQVQSINKMGSDSYRGVLYSNYKDNYLRSIDKVFGSRGQPLKDLLSNVDAKWMYDNYYLNSELTIDFVYLSQLDGDGVDNSDIDDLIADWERLLVLSGKG